MKIYQRLLRYYCTSGIYFQDHITWFCISHYLIGDCGSAKSRFESCLYGTWQQKLEQDGGFVIHLSDSTIKDYFENIQNNEVLCAVLFAHWLHLSLATITDIRSSQNGFDAWKKVSETALSGPDRYTIYTDSGEVSAIKEGAYLVTEDGQRYEIDL